MQAYDSEDKHTPYKMDVEMKPWTDLSKNQKQFVLAEAKLANNQLANNQLANNQLANNQLANNQLANNQLANNQLADIKLANNHSLMSSTHATSDQQQHRSEYYQ